MQGDPLYDLRQRISTTTSVDYIPAPKANYLNSDALIEEMRKRTQTPLGQEIQYAEVNRICSLPVTTPLTQKEEEDINRRFLLAQAYESGFRLFPTQAAGISEYEKYNKLVGSIGVGWGKTLLSFAVAGIAYLRGKRKIIYSCPASVFSQVTDTDLPWARSKIHIPFAAFNLGGKNSQQRKNIAYSNRDGLYLIPNSLFSVKDTEEILYAINADLLIIDECQNYKSSSAARTRRLLKYAHKRDLVALSGTITTKSIKDYSHIVNIALRQNSPFPLSHSLVVEWSNILDAETEEVPQSLASLEPLADWARCYFPSIPVTKDRTGIRKAFKLRKQTAPGVIEVDDLGIDCSLSIQNKAVQNYKEYENFNVIEFYVKQLTEQWISPNGDEIEHAMLLWRWLYELSTGFFNKLTWPNPEEYGRRRTITTAQATEELARAKEQHLYQQEYAKELRKFLLDDHRKGLDTPKLVGLEFSRNKDANLPNVLYRLWERQNSFRFPNMPIRDSSCVRICGYKIHDACMWAKNEVPKGEGGLIWVYNRGVGIWLYEWLLHYGVDALYCGAGDAYNDAIRDIANANKIVVASIPAHKEGKNLQHFQNQYILQWPRSASVAEQMLGRTHRNGQKAEALVVRTNNTTLWDDMNFAACLNDALYMHQTATRQKLIIAGYSPLPPIFNSSFLIERGLDVAVLSREQQQMLQSKFTF